MAASLYNDWYVSPTWSDVGPSTGSSSAKQKHNATKIYNWASNLMWSLNAIAAVLGNMQVESGLDPACSYPRIGTTMETIDNDHALNHPNNAYGLVQWKGQSSAAPITNQLVSYAIRYNTQWYDGNIQLQRLEWEYNSNVKFHPQTVDGIYWTFASFSTSVQSPETLAKVWMVCYEGTYSVLSNRQNNARMWYDYFDDNPPEPLPDDWVSGSDFADVAYSYKDSGYTYEDYDCIGFVNLAWKNTQTPARSANLTNGTNSIWRSSRYFPTSYNGQSPVLELYWKGTISECEEEFGEIPQGALLFRCIPEGQPGYDTIPSQYYGDGIGNFTHVGIFVSPLGGSGSVMQSGGYGGSGVHLSGWRDDYWTHVAFVCYVYYDSEEEEEEDDRYWFYSMLTARRKKGVNKIVRIFKSTI